MFLCQKIVILEQKVFKTWFVFGKCWFLGRNHFKHLFSTKLTLKKGITKRDKIYHKFTTIYSTLRFHRCHFRKRHSSSESPQKWFSRKCSYVGRKCWKQLFQIKSNVEKITFLDEILLVYPLKRDMSPLAAKPPDLINTCISEITFGKYITTVNISWNYYNFNDSVYYKRKA